MHSGLPCFGCGNVIPVVTGLANDTVLMKCAVVVLHDPEKYEPTPTVVDIIVFMLVVTDIELNASKISIKQRMQ